MRFSFEFRSENLQIEKNAVSCLRFEIMAIQKRVYFVPVGKSYVILRLFPLFRSNFPILPISQFTVAQLPKLFSTA
jgi:hypothetical protein